MYKLDVGNNKIHSVINIQYLIWYCSWKDPFQCGSKELGLLEYADSISNDSEIDRIMYEIECVVDYRDTRYGREYLIYWKGLYC